MEKVVNRLIDNAVEGVDTYKTDGSTWLIFTETKKWVIELTKDGTLWYNYNFFKDLLAYLSMDVVENQHYITKWVENNVINKVKRTLDLELRNQLNVEDAIENGVKDVRTPGVGDLESTMDFMNENNTLDVQKLLDDVIENGVKHTMDIEFRNKFVVEDTIQNGVIETKLTTSPFTNYVEDAIENGVKETIDLEMDDEEVVEYYIENSVKETTPSGYLGSIEMKGKIVHQFESPKQNNEVEDTIQNGVIETKLTTSPFTNYVEDAIENGVKDTLFGVDPDEGRVEDTIENGVKETIDLEMDDEEVVEYFIENGVKETTPSGYLGSIVMKGEIVHQFESPKQNNEVEDTIQNGVKETLNTAYMPQEMVEETIETGIKETKTPGKDGNIKSTLEWVSKNGTFSVRELIDGVIENGLKQTKRSYDGSRKQRTKYTIENGVKEIKIGAPDNRDYFIKDTIENGVKLTNSSLQIDGSCVIEDVIKEGVKYTGGIGNPNWMGNKVEKAIENGVKDTKIGSNYPQRYIENTIKNGVKETCCHDMKLTKSVEKIIQKGIKNTYSDILPKEYDWSNQFDVQEVIDNGVKHTEYGDWEDGDERLDDIIQNGVKVTLNEPHHRQREVVQTMKEGIKETIGEDYPHTNRIDGVIKNGVKETLSSIYPIERVVEKVVEVGVLETKSMDEWVNTDNIVNKVMNNGIKEVQPLPAQDGNRDWGNYYYRKGEPTKPHTKYVDDVLEKGEKI
jgi:predicted peroxiredoxin